MFAAEVIKGAHDELRARGVSDEFLDERDLRSYLDGVPLPERDRRILEAKVRLLAVQMKQLQDGGDVGGVDEGPEEGAKRPPPKGGDSGMIHQASHSAGHTCICMSTGIPGMTQSLSGLNPLPSPPTGQSSITIAVIFTAPVYGNIITDALRLVVESGAAFGLGPSDMLVGLASQVSWAKEIYAWNLCRGKLASVHQNGLNLTPSYMLLKKGCDGADTIVFAKPSFFGIWGDRANFDFTLFWTVFGGRRLTFTWIMD